jgi:hypothetical protein
MSEKELFGRKELPAMKYKSAALLLTLGVLFSSSSIATERFFLEPMTAEPGIEGDDSKASVAYNVMERVRRVCGDKFVEAEQEASQRVHIHILQLKKVSGGSRFWVGPFRGNSTITLTLTVSDREGKKLLTRTFNRRGNWFLGSVTVGATDNRMLTTIAEDVCGQLVPQSGAEPASTE